MTPHPTAGTRPSAPWRTVVVDDSPDLRFLVRNLLGKRSEFTVVGEGATGLEAVTLAGEHQPDLMLLDLSMPEMDGLQALPEVLAASPDTKVIVFSGFDDGLVGEKARSLGAVGYAQKDESIATLPQRILDVLDPGHVAPTPDESRPVAALDEGAVLADHVERFRTAFDEAGVGMAALSLSLHVVRANAAFARLVGREEPWFAGADLADVVGDGMDQLRPHLARLVDGTERDCQLELGLHHADGRIVSCLVHVVTVADSAGRPLYLFLQAQDVSRLKRAEERFRILLETAPDGMVIVAADGTIALVNEATEQMFGYPRSELLGRPVETLLPERFRDRHEQHRGAFATAATRRSMGVRAAELLGRRRDGSEFPVEISLSPLESPGEGQLISAAVRDVTDRSTLVRALATLSRCNQVLVHATDEAQLLVDMCDTVVQAGGYKLAWIGVCGTDASRAVPVVAASGATGYLDGLQVSWGDDARGWGPTGQAIRTLQPVWCADLQHDPRTEPWWDLARAHGLRTSLAVPLVVEGSAWGALSIYDDDPKAFTPEAQRLLRELAGDAAFGIAALHNRTRVAESLERAIGALAATLEVRDPYTSGHQHRVADFAGRIATRLGLDKDRIEGLRVGASLHDIGKIAVPGEILSRSGTLSAAEFELIKSHPDVGYHLVSRIDFPWPVADIVRQHHERYDGSGYPHGLAGEAIRLEARILTVADVVEAVTHRRPYRGALGIEEAVAELRERRGTWYDPLVVDACLDLIAEGVIPAGPDDEPPSLVR